MAQAGFTPILIYASGTATNVPAAGNLTSSASGAELAINYADGKLYYKDSGGSVQLIASKSGASGDVVGPASATDNAIVRFDGTTGKLVQNSVVTIADSTGDISGVGVLNATTLDATNIEVTNIKAKDGTAAASIADSTGKITVSTELAVDNLNLSGNTLSSTDANGNIVLAPNGTGDVQLDADTVRIGDSNANATLTTNGTGDLILNTNSGTNSGSITIADGANGDMTLTPDGNGSVVITNNGTSNALRITQTGTGNALVVEDSANPDATPFVVDASGNVGIGGTTIAGFKVSNYGNLSGAVTAYSYYAGSTFQSDVTTNGIGFGTFLGTQAASFTLTSLAHFRTAQGTFGAGSTITNQFGFEATNTLTGATNNYGFYSDIASGTGRYNFYANGTADNYFAGSVGIGGVASAFQKLYVSGTLPSGSANSRVIVSEGTIPATTTTLYNGFRTEPSTAASAFTLGTLTHFSANQGTIGAGSTVTSQYGFTAEASLTGATNNYGFYSNIASGTNRWNFYGNGTARNYFAGRLNLADGTDVGAGIFSNYNISGSGGIGYGIKQHNTVTSSVTTDYIQYQSLLYTQATAFTLPGYRHYAAGEGVIGAGSTVTNQYGFIAESSLTGATNNYGFFSNIASGTNRWNFYANGTAQNYFEGLVGLKTTANNGGYLEIGGTANVVSNSGYGVTQYQTIPSTATSQYWLNTTVCSTAAASFTLSDLRHYNAGQGTFGAGSTVTSQYGFFAQSNLTGATNNYGFYSNIASGAGRYNFYANGTASNYFAGDMQLDKTVTATGTTGAQTINKNAGTVNFAAAATSLVVTDSRVTANSIIICTVGTNDTTMKSVAAVAGAGSFTLHANAAATAETRVDFLIIN